MGTAVASLLSPVPWLVSLSRDKIWTIAIAGRLIAAGFGSATQRRRSMCGRRSTTCGAVGKRGFDGCGGEARFSGLNNRRTGGGRATRGRSGSSASRDVILGVGLRSRRPSASRSARDCLIELERSRDGGGGVTACALQFMANAETAEIATGRNEDRAKKPCGRFVPAKPLFPDARF
jgi:hypothetical protein